MFDIQEQNTTFKRCNAKKFHYDMDSLTLKKALLGSKRHQNDFKMIESLEFKWRQWNAINNERLVASEWYVALIKYRINIYMVPNGTIYMFITYTYTFYLTRGSFV